MKLPTFSIRALRTSPEWRLMQRMFRYFLPYKAAILGAFVSSVVVSLSTAATAWLIKPALDDIFISKNTTALVYIPLAFIGLTLLKGAGRYLQNWCMNFSALRVLETLRQELFHKIVSLPLRFYEETQVGALMSRVLNDVGVIRQSLPAFIQMIRQIMTMLGLLFVVFQQNFTLACWAVIVLPLAGAPFAAFSRALRRYGRKDAEILATVSGMLQELLSGIRVIKAFATEKREIATFDRENAKIVTIAMKQANVAELASPVMESVGSLGIGLIIWYGGHEVISGAMTPGTFFTFMAALVMLYEPVKSLNAANMTVQRALAGAERVFAILDDPALVTESGGDRDFDGHFRELVFDRVSLHYASQAGSPGEAAREGTNALASAAAASAVASAAVGSVGSGATVSGAAAPVAAGEVCPDTRNGTQAPRMALDGIDLVVRAGERVALVGPSGAGKTSLVNLIPRFYSPTLGSIRLNGLPLESHTLPSLRRHVAMVSQDAFLFDLSLAENIAYGQPSVDMVAVEAAARAAFAHDFIVDLPEGYATRIGERGVKLSGGQKQRITIARALVKNAPLLILDEATSALDSQSEQMVQRALENLMQGRTSIIIAHRLSTILEADRIVVMEQGRIVDSGRHDELLGRCGLYARLYAMQFRTGDNAPVAE